MEEEKLRILKLLEERRITSAEAMELLEAMGRPAAAAAGTGRVLKIRVFESGSPEAKVNVSLPLAWAKFMVPFIEGKIKAKLAEKGHDVDLEKIREAIENQEPMKIVDIQDGGDRVEIYIE